MSEPARLRAALFVDFDNVYLGLKSVDEKAAELFATDPASWTAAVTDGDGRGAGRRFLIRNCYLNPSTFSRYRANWTRAGFRVVDCPSLTQQGKSSTDINLVLDAVDVLADPIGVDEFFIASADADFTSLVQRIRAADRETTVIVAGAVASAYRSMADHVVETDDLIELIKGKVARTESEPFAEARTAVRALLATAAGPVALAQLAHRARMADSTITRDWGSFGSFRLWLEALGGGIGINTEQSPAVAWDSTRFRAPNLEIPDEGVAEQSADSYEVQMARVAGIPPLSQEQYATAIRAIAGDLSSHPFDRVETSKRVRDACAATGAPVSRANVATIITGLLYSGVPMEPSTPETIAEAWARNSEALCRGARVEFDEDGLRRLRTWVSGGLLGA